jgi:hypothetical protein
MKLVIDTWRGVDINDGVNYIADFPDGTPLVSPTTPIGVDMLDLPSTNVGRRHGGPTVSIFVQPQTDYRDKREELKDLFRTEEKFTFYPLVVHDEDDSDRVWSIEAAVLTGTPKDDAFIFVLAPKTFYWRSAVVGDTHEFTASAQEIEYTIPMIAPHKVRPTITLVPTNAKSGGYLYQRWVPLRNFSNTAQGIGPYDLGVSLDTAALITAGKIRSDGFDLRVLVNDVEVPRWFGNWNTADTKIWINLQAPNTYGLRYKTDIAAAGAVANIDMTETPANRERFKGWPASGVFVIGEELFFYTTKTDTPALMRISGITRAYRGTAMAAHTAAANGLNLQLTDIKLLYGNNDAADPEYSDEDKPTLDLDLSTNSSHVFTVFGDGTGKRKPQWVWTKYRGDSPDTGGYTGNYGEQADPFVAMGHKVTSQDVGGTWMSDTVALRWEVTPAYKLTGISASGETYRNTEVSPSSRIYTGYQNRWVSRFIADPPVLLDTWEPWSASIVGITDPVDVVNINFNGSIGGVEGAIAMHEIQEVTLTYDPATVPIPAMTPEVGIYVYDMLIENLTTGHKIAVKRAINVASPATGELVIDTENHTVLANNWNRTTAGITPYNSREWFLLDPGPNLIRVTDVGLNGVEVTLEGPGTRGV